MVVSLESLKTNRAKILALADKHGTSNVRVFGSVAREEVQADSDVDFLIDLEQGRSLLDLDSQKFYLDPGLDLGRQG